MSPQTYIVLFVQEKLMPGLNLCCIFIINTEMHHSKKDGNVFVKETALEKVSAYSAAIQNDELLGFEQIKNIFSKICNIHTIYKSKSVTTGEKYKQKLS